MPDGSTKKTAVQNEKYTQIQKKKIKRKQNQNMLAKRAQTARLTSTLLVCPGKT